jgi:uncharacterized membrane protein (UPF0182 family)
VIFAGAEPTEPTTADVTPTASPSPAPEATATPAPAGPTPTESPPPATNTPVALSGDAAELARQASDAYERAQTALQAGDFATYGTEIQLVEQLLQRLVELTNQP